jgi:hypothetical protein
MPHPNCLHLFRPLSRRSKALMCHVREGEQLEEELAGVLRPEETAALLRATHRPLYCCQVLTSLVRQAQLQGQAGLAGEQGAPAELVPTMASFRLDEGIATFTVSGMGAWGGAAALPACLLAVTALVGVSVRVTRVRLGQQRPRELSKVAALSCGQG